MNLRKLALRMNELQMLSISVRCQMCCCIQKRGECVCVCGSMYSRLLNPLWKKIKISALISNTITLAEDDMHPFTLQTHSLKFFPLIFSVCANLSVCITIFCVLHVWNVRISVCSRCLSKNYWDVYWRDSGDVIKMKSRALNWLCRHRTSLNSNRIRSDEITRKVLLIFLTAFSSYWNSGYFFHSNPSVHLILLTQWTSDFLFCHQIISSLRHSI